MVWNHTWMKFDRQGEMSPKKDCWCWLIFQHPEWKSWLCSESSDDWKFKGTYWFVVGRVLWLVMRVVIGALMKASLETRLKCTNLHSPSSLPIKMQTRASLHLFQFPIFRHLSLKMTSSQDVEMLVTTYSPFQDSFHPHDQIPCKYFCNLFCFQCLSKWPLLSGFLASLGYCCYFLFLLSFFL